jgi:hypothetical protein
MKTPGCELLPNATWLMLNSAPQPDASLYIRANAKILNDLMSGAPELAVEVTRSTRSYDLGPKLALYQRAGVQEYLAAITDDEQLEWRSLHRGRYRLLEPDAGGIYRSLVFPGLWIDSKAFWKGDSTRLLQVLNEGLTSAGHLQFRERMASTKS